MKNIKDRFLTYVAIDTQSENEPKQFPSSEKQRDLSKVLAEELKALGATDVSIGENANVYGKLAANYEGCKAPKIGFCAHIDTSPDLPGENVKARVVENYDGKDIVLNEEGPIITEVSEFPHLKNYIGDDLVVTDGTTLLGADCKAGIAIIMDMVQYFYSNPDVKHGELQFLFTSDEEVGCYGAKNFDNTKFNPDFAYTLDGGPWGEITYECFNGTDLYVIIKGTNIHPGLAKNKMKNSILIANEFLNMLPCAETPGNTQGYEGYYHAIEFHGLVELTRLKFLLRDHDRELLKVRKNRIIEISEFLNKVYGQGTVSYEINDVYNNMSEMILPKFEIVEAVQNTMRGLGTEPFSIPMRGGTDGAELSYMGIPCPNICTGGHNFHSRYEYVSVQSMEKTSKLLAEVVKGFAK